jgi:hypothetical protein
LFFRGSRKTVVQIIVAWQVVHPEEAVLYGQFSSLL